MLKKTNSFKLTLGFGFEEGEGTKNNPMHTSDPSQVFLWDFLCVNVFL